MLQLVERLLPLTEGTQYSCLTMRPDHDHPSVVKGSRRAGSRTGRAELALGRYRRRRGRPLRSLVGRDTLRGSSDADPRRGRENPFFLGSSGLVDSGAQRASGGASSRDQRRVPATVEGDPRASTGS
jgi:hypothetical protein